LQEQQSARLRAQATDYSDEQWDLSPPPGEDTGDFSIVDAMAAIHTSGQPANSSDDEADFPPQNSDESQFSPVDTRRQIEDNIGKIRVLGGQHPAVLTFNCLSPNAPLIGHAIDELPLIRVLNTPEKYQSFLEAAIPPPADDTNCSPIPTVGPGLLDTPETFHSNPVIITLFHILTLRLLIPLWPNDDETLTQLAQVFASMARSCPHSLAFRNLSDPDLPDWRKCPAFAQAILGAIVEATPDFLMPRIEKLFCFDLLLASMDPVQSRGCVLSVPTSPSDNLHNCLEAFFAGNNTIEPRPPITRWIWEWPRFLFIHLDRHMGTPLDCAPDCRPFSFDQHLNMSPYGYIKKSRNRSQKVNYRLVGCISYTLDTDAGQANDVTMLAIFGQWFRFEGTHVRTMPSIDECADRYDESGSWQLATLLLYCKDC
jgi:hypothetical protein